MDFFPHLGSFFVLFFFFFHYVLAKFHLWPSSGDFTANSDRNAESCNRIPSNYCLPLLLSIAPRFWPSKPLAGLGRIWNHYLLTMLTWNRGAADRGVESNLHTVVWFQVFWSNTNNYMVSSNYFYLVTVLCLHIWFQVTNHNNPS